jgi:site-specific recombinase XerD
MPQTLLSSFRLYLKAQGKKENTIRNYLQDIDHFFSWFSSQIKSFPLSALLNDPNKIAQNITIKNLTAYQRFLEKSEVSPTTINRRLSSLRQLTKFFLSQGWLKEDPTKKLANISLEKETDKTSHTLEKFAKALEEEGKSKTTIRNYLSDVRGFLEWKNE